MDFGFEVEGRLSSRNTRAYYKLHALVSPTCVDRTGHLTGRIAISHVTPHGSLEE